MAVSTRTGPIAGSSASSAASERGARARLRKLIVQHPLFETAPSSLAVDGATTALQAKTVFAGIGLVSGDAVTRALPLDVMGLLLSAEQARRTLAAERLIVLVADAHARESGAPRELLERRSIQYLALLRGIAEGCGFHNMHVVLGSEWERDPAYRRTFEAVARSVPAHTDPYVLREVADIAHVERTHGSVIKVGWALQRSRHNVKRDERTFDETFERWVGGAACFVYSKAGRALDDRRQKVSPYIVSDETRRICIDASESVADKLARARTEISHSTFRGVYNHLHALTRSYCELVRPLRGAVPERAQAVIDDALEAAHAAERRAALAPPAQAGRLP